MLQLRSGYKFNYQGSEDEKIDEVDGTAFGASRTEEGSDCWIISTQAWAVIMPRLIMPLPCLGILDSVHQFSLKFQF